MKHYNLLIKRWMSDAWKFAQLNQICRHSYACMYVYWFAIVIINCFESVTENFFKEKFWKRNRQEYDYKLIQKVELAKTSLLFTVPSFWNEVISYLSVPLYRTLPFVLANVLNLFWRVFMIFNQPIWCVAHIEDLGETWQWLMHINYSI